MLILIFTNAFSPLWASNKTGNQVQTPAVNISNTNLAHSGQYQEEGDYQYIGQV